MMEAEYKRLHKQMREAGFGACEKIHNCQFASKACFLSYNLGSPLYKKRYLLCFAWRHPKEMKHYMETGHLEDGRL